MNLAMVKLLLVKILLTKNIVDNLEGDAFKLNLIFMENFSGNLAMDCSTMFLLFPVGLSMDPVA